MIEMKNIILKGLAAGVAMLAASLVLTAAFGALFPTLAAEYATPLFRPWSDPVMLYAFINPFVAGVLLAWLWANVAPLLKRKDAANKAVAFGGAAWLAFNVPGMLMTLSSFNVSAVMVASWSAIALVQYLLAGVVFAKLEK